MFINGSNNLSLFTDDELKMLDKAFTVFTRNLQDDDSLMTNEELNNFLKNSNYYLLRIIKIIKQELDNDLNNVFNTFLYYVENNNRFFSYLYYFILFTKLLYLDLESRKEWIEKIEKVIEKESEQHKPWLRVSSVEILKKVITVLKTKELKELDTINISRKIKSIRNHIVKTTLKTKDKIQILLELCFIKVSPDNINELMMNKKLTISFVIFLALSFNLRFLIEFLTTDRLDWLSELDKIDRLVVLFALLNYSEVLPFVIRFLFFMAIAAKFPRIFGIGSTSNNTALKSFLINKKRIFNNKVQQYLMSLYGLFVLSDDKDVLKILKNKSKCLYLGEISRPFKIFKREYIEQLFNKLCEFDYVLAITILVLLYLITKSRMLEEENKHILVMFSKLFDKHETIVSSLDNILSFTGNKLGNINISIEYHDKINQIFTIKFKVKNIYSLMLTIQKKEDKFIVNGLKTTDPTTPTTTANTTEVSTGDPADGICKKTRIRHRKAYKRVRDNIVKINH